MPKNTNPFTLKNLNDYFRLALILPPDFFGDIVDMAEGWKSLNRKQRLTIVKRISEEFQKEGN